MVSTTTKNKRSKRPDTRPNGKRRRHEVYARQERDRLERVAQREARNQPKIEKLEKLAPLTGVPSKERNNALKQPQKSAEEIRVRALHKLLRQIQGLEEKKNGGTTLEPAQERKLARMEEVLDELEELQKVEE